MVTEKKEMTTKFIAGAFFIAGMLLISVVVFAIGKNKGIAESKFSVTVYFSNVGGLIEGSPVRLSGVTVGTVADIGFLSKEFQGRNVSIVLNIYKRFHKQLEKNVHFTIKTEGLLGEKYVEISVVDTEGSVNLKQPIIGEDPVDPQDLALIFAEAAQTFTKTSNDLSNIDFDELTRVLGEAATSLSETSKGINTVLTEVQYLSVKSKRLMNRVEQKLIDGDLFKVF